MEKMSSVSTRGAVTFVLLLLVIVGSSAENEDCSQYDIGQLTPCSNAVVPNGGPPDSACCAMLNTWGIDCLCAVLTKDANSGGVPSYVDRDRVIAMPGECKMEVRKGYTCDGTNFP